MKLILALLFVSSSAFAIDTGDGSDGVCNVTGGADTTITAARKSYQCSELHIDANLDVFNGSHAGAGGAAVVIKVQNNVTLSAGVTLDLSGGDGLAGDTTVASKVGGAGGAGGSSGGSSSAPGVDGSNGNGPGAGFGGKYVPPFNNSTYGGGGGGGSYKTQGALVATDGDNVGGTGPFGSEGLNGAIYGNEATFDSSFTGGSGGGAGGGGMETNVTKTGSSGGGGGGAIRIIAGGNITIDGTISAKGGAGGGTSGTTFTGAGGGGSGGAIWLQAGGALTISASGIISALGGANGENDYGAGFGGDGGFGRIRLDDADGVITNAGITTPTPYSTSFTPTATPTPITNPMNRAYTSGVSCAKVSEENNPVMNLVNVILGMMIAGSAHYFLSRKSKV